MCNNEPANELQYMNLMNCKRRNKIKHKNIVNNIKDHKIIKNIKKIIKKFIKNIKNKNIIKQNS